MPLEAANSMLGAVAFSSVRAPRDWPEELVQRLRLVAQIFANALLRPAADAGDDHEARAGADEIDQPQQIKGWRAQDLPGGAPVGRASCTTPARRPCSRRL